ncbi:MAG TPA: hypothetical protein VGI24_07595 [Solirubrobacteraceae bacterium]
MSTRVEGKKKPRTVRRLVFTADPADTDIPIITADVIYNLRSSLDHLMSALVAKKDRSSAMFPIYFDGVWEAIVPGENQQRVKERTRWASDIKTLPDAAIAVLQRLQPPEDGWDNTDANLIQLVNRLSNRDRHEKLPTIAPGLLELTVRFKLPDGKRRTKRAPIPPGSVLEDKAQIADIPDGAVDVKIEGVPLVAIDIAHEVRYVPLPAKLDAAARFIEERVIPSLSPFVRGDTG